jgi:RND superfamily putative drug exporter
VPGLRRRLSRLRIAILRQPTRRPVVTALACAIPLLALATGLLRLEVGNRTIGALPQGSEPRVAYRQASEGFAPGILSPTVILVEDEGIAQKRPQLRRLQDLIAERPAVAAVLGLRQVRLPVEFGAVLSSTGDAARFFVVLDRNPLGSRAIAAVLRLEEDLPELLRQAGLTGAEANLAGDTALSAETVTKSRQDLARVVPVSTLLVFVILALFLRALVAPLYLVLTSLLALAASIGLTVFVFQDILGHGELAFYVPFAAVVLLVALGSDYNVYLVGRVWDEARRRDSLREAVEVAGIKAAGAITIAGLVLAASFASLALVPLRPFQELGFAVSLGLLIDAFIVRSLLAPALITLVGERSGWPGTRLRSSK